MPWGETGVVDQRRQFVVLARNRAKPITQLCRDFGIARSTAYKWLERYAAAGHLNALEDRSRRPKRSPNRTPEKLERRVVELRDQYGWGGRKLQVLLLEEGIDLTEPTVNRILTRRGLIDKEKSKKPATRRFERDRPNELWQMDFKGEHALEGQGWCYPLTILDDHSRYLMGLSALNCQKRIVVQPRLLRAFEEFGLPDAMLMDHGVPWWSTTNGHGLTRFSVWLIKQNIDLIYSAVRHPQTQGKIERLHRTLKQSLKHRGCRKTLPGFRQRFQYFRAEYNNVRPHEALSMETPASRYRPSVRSYDPSPPPWDYPNGADVRKLDTQGKLRIPRGQYFVCEALAEEYVMCQEFDGKLLVSFRNMEIREIELATGRTMAMVRPVARTRVSAMS